MKFSLKKPVFIVGPARSGTSILYRSLQQHTSFKPVNAPFGINLGESNVFNLPFHKLLNLFSPDPNALGFMLNRLPAHFLFCVSAWPYWLLKLITGRKYNRRPPVYGSDDRREQEWKRCFGHRILRRYFSVAGRTRGCRRLLEKTPAHIQRLSEIRATFSDVFFLVSVRHPVDVFSSYKRRLADEKAVYDGQAGEWLELTAQTFIAIYRQEAQAIVKAAREMPDTLMVVRYEQFVASPEESLSRILETLGEAFDDTCMVGDISDKHHHAADPMLFKPVTQKTKDWREFISREEALEIENQLAGLIRELGYDRYTE